MHYKSCFWVSQCKQRCQLYQELLTTYSLKRTRYSSDCCQKSQPICLVQIWQVWISRHFTLCWRCYQDDRFFFHKKDLTTQLNWSKKNFLRTKPFTTHYEMASLLKKSFNTTKVSAVMLWQKSLPSFKLTSLKYNLSEQRKVHSSRKCESRRKAVTRSLLALVL